MKRKIPSLQLSRETIRQLDNDKLAHANGGVEDWTTITTIFSVVVSCP